MIDLPIFFISWVCAYLNNRTQYVEINGKTSGTLPVSSTVALGGVLGQVLFLIYTNYLVSVINEPIKIGLFPDDCALYNDIHFTNDQPALSIVYNNILTWCNEWRMELNSDKTVLHVTKRLRPFKFSYSMAFKPLTEVCEYRYLAVTYKK